MSLICTGGLTAKAGNISLLSDDSIIDINPYGYKFGLLQQSAHYIRLKASYLTDLLARYLNQVSTGEWPTRAVCSSTHLSDSTHATSFSFQMSEGESTTSTTDSTLLAQLSTVVQSLLPKATVSKDTPLEDQILAYTHQQQAIVDAKELLFLMFQTFGAHQAATPALDRMMG